LKENFEGKRAYM